MAATSHKAPDGLSSVEYERFMSLYKNNKTPGQAKNQGLLKSGQFSRYETFYNGAKAEASNYQAVLHEKLYRLKQTADIKSYNGEYSALIFRVEDMSMLDQILCYTNGLKPRTRIYVKLENPATLSAAMDLAVKYEVAHFVEDARDRQVRQRSTKSTNDALKPSKPFKGKSFRGKGRFKPKSDSIRADNRACYFCKKPEYIKADCFSWKKDCGATTIYVSKHWVVEHQLQTTKFRDKNIRVKLGDNKIVEAEVEVLLLEIAVSGLGKKYKCVAVVYAIPDEFNCILGIHFFEDMQPLIDWRGRKIEGTKAETLYWERTSETRGPIEEGGLKESTNAVRGQHQDALAGKDTVVNSELDSHKRECIVEEAGDNGSTRGKDNVVEKMFTMGVVDEVGVQTKYITRNKLKKFLRLKTKSIDEPDFMLLLSNETIRQVARSLQRQDQPDNIVNAKAQRYLETDWESSRDNPAFNF
ncbi:hypothetical protein PHPALM_27967 [Phytophthora palmivora]|uniref:Ty3 transposon capsid-like protein domain-containing protein n=1 Tax=Phytophthora palmivora TaxID=4796 RepID=A0A2P4XBA3_9STRA|nr:hypothetical protein PHPALM_27967 [Phytophthora palmivora]